jgi:hypothetical protein
LETATYEAVEADPGALRQAAVVVAAFGVSAGLGLSGGAPVSAVLTLTGGALAGWLSWALVVYYVGAGMLAERQTRADPAEIARTLGFSAAPGVLLALVAVPIVRPVALALVTTWMLAAMVVAVRHALDFAHLPRAIAVCLVGWTVVAILALAIGVAFGPVVH